MISSEGGENISIAHLHCQMTTHSIFPLTIKLFCKHTKLEKIVINRAPHHRQHKQRTQCTGRDERNAALHRGSNRFREGVICLRLASKNQSGLH